MDNDSTDKYATVPLAPQEQEARVTSIAIEEVGKEYQVKPQSVEIAADCGIPTSFERVRYGIMESRAFAYGYSLEVDVQT